MLDWQERVVSEKTGIDANLGRLEEFIESKHFLNLPTDEQKRMRRQAVLMGLYSETLAERIANFT